MKFTKILSHKVFLFGLLLRLIVMPFTGHWDIRGINFAIYNLPYKGITNIYEVAAHAPVDYFVNVNFGRDYFIYPPLTYATLGATMMILKPFYGSEFRTWIEGYGNDLSAVITHPHVWRYLFLMKLPYLFFDTFLLYTLMKFFQKKKLQELALKYWWLNPIVIFLPYIWGQFDIIPTAVMLLGVLFGTKNKPYSAALLFGLAASFKNYPLLLLPFLAVVTGKNFVHMCKIFVTGLIPFILTTLPFFNHEFFRSTVLFSWQSQKMLDFNLRISSADLIYPFFIGYTAIFLWSLYAYHQRPNTLHKPITLILLLYYATTNFHQQWFMWVMPYLVIIITNDPKLRLIGIWGILLFFIRLICIQANVTTELFIWLAPFFDDLPKSRDIIGIFYDIERFRGIVNSLIAGTVVFFTAYLLKGKNEPIR